MIYLGTFYTYQAYSKQVLLILIIENWWHEEGMINFTRSHLDGELRITLLQ